MLLKQKEIAELIGVSERTIERWRKDRIMPYKKVNGRIRFDPTIIEKWLDKKEVRMKSIA
jgi:excisionase family DNA binding protein